ncbi:ABC transporter substrate-binding protein [Streptantibioticus rubrisoli]|uniref:ABC transporter substrate-binding protein n=1 Tax=Streptantibioticus rubrisoli TaxID=1387313 RepID=A0ABT1P7S4_9ACTN|nr:ABC transporter substrate-binding protein [Streptantibioticus rubrisoli]MCQ4041405.1 ABC transporter substrate-binding protein [Streptantibioticus rubrisoli]
MKRTVALAATTCALTLLTTACGGSGANSSSPSGATASNLNLPDLHGQHLEVAAVWTGPEQQNFMKVIKRFDQLTGAQTDFVPTGDNVSTFLGTKIQGGAAPDVAFLPQPGVLAQFAKSGWLKPVNAAVEKQLQGNYSTGWQKLGAYNGTQYGVYFKAADKSTVWYNTKAFSTAGVSTPPTTWSEFLKDAQTISDSGTPPVSVGGADGWTLTDWFENIYLSQAGPAKYDQLTKHQIKWTDPSVGKALTTLGQLFGKPSLLAGGTRGALATEFPASVDQTFADPAKAAMVYEADFVATNITSDTKAKIGTDAKVFPFPAVDGGQAPMVVGGDVAVALKNSKGAQALLTYLASTDAARTEVEQGGFISPNKSLDLSAYPDETERSLAKSLTAAGDNFRFDMSDQAPAAFGGTKGQGEWKDLQDFLANPSDVAGAQRKLEADAAAAFANAG